MLLGFTSSCGSSCERAAEFCAAIILERRDKFGGVRTFEGGISSLIFEMAL